MSGIFDFDDPTASAEDRMNSAFGCLVMCVIGALIVLAFVIWVIWRLA